MTDTTHIIISRALHALLKKYCRDNGLVMQVLAEEIIQGFFDIDESPGAFRVSDPRVIAAQKKKNRIRSRMIAKRL